MVKEKLAKVLSVILGPQLWLPALLLITLFKVDLSWDRIKILLPILFILQVIIPIGYIYLMARTGQVTAWDLPKREERHPFLRLTLTSYLVAIVFIYLFGNQPLLNLSLIIFALLMIISVTTAFWKISFHTSLNTGGAILVNFLFDWKLPWLYLTIPIILWARFILIRHSLAQLLAGIGLSGAFILGIFKYWGYF